MSDLEFVNHKRRPSSGHKSTRQQLVLGRGMMKLPGWMEMRLRNKRTAEQEWNICAGGPSSRLWYESPHYTVFLHCATQGPFDQIR